MNYTDQQQFLSRSRMWGAAAALLLLVTAAASLEIAGTFAARVAVSFGLTSLALAISLYYTPDYLHLAVNWTRRPQWQIKIRWRVLGAALMIGLLSASNRRGAIVVVLSVAWLTGANLLAKWLGPRRYFAAYFWTTDFALLAVLLLAARCDLLLGAMLLAAAGHLSIVICEKHPLPWAGIVTGSSWFLILLSSVRRGADLKFAMADAGLILVAALGTASLVRRAEEHNTKNVGAAMRELTDFTGYSPDRIRHLWSVSDQELAKNWQLAGIAPDNRERLAEWYRKNSELYLFAISAYNLAYKRIRSNLHVLQFALGSCLDYGAGNGELVLELARRGHAATYYDVQGATMRFARQRAAQQSLTIEFALSKEELAAIARRRGFDTVFAFDVLEHLPDLPGELDFLSSLLSPGGLLVFDAPGGSTKSHPMHLNHNLDLRAHLRAKGLKEQRILLYRLPFRKEEKYVFRAPASPVQNVPGVSGSSLFR